MYTNFKFYFQISLNFIMGLNRMQKNLIVIAIELLYCIFATWLAFGLRLNSWGGLNEHAWLAFIVSYFIFLPIFLYLGLYQAIYRFVGIHSLAKLLKGLFLYSVIYTLSIVILGNKDIPRSIAVIQSFALALMIFSTRSLIANILYINLEHKSYNRSVGAKKNTVIYGANKFGQQLALDLSEGNEFVVKAFVDEDKSIQGGSINGIPVFGNCNLSSLIHRFEISDVLMAVPFSSQSKRNEIISSFIDLGVRIKTLPRISDFISGSIGAFNLQDFDLDDLLARSVIPPDILLMKKNIVDKNILITGAGGSIGAELCRQIIKFSPKSIILVDSSEHALYLIVEELTDISTAVFSSLSRNDEQKKSVEIISYLASVRDEARMNQIFSDHSPHTVFHAAAYKHVPIVEKNISEGIDNNVFGTLTCAMLSLRYAVAHFILISTDKAVRPTNIMGVSKRIAEMILQALAQSVIESGKQTLFSMVRFGNVLGSSGSVVPRFSSQIKFGGPITLTHTEVTRYFMTIPEASQLVIQASSMAKGGMFFYWIWARLFGFMI